MVALRYSDRVGDALHALAGVLESLEFGPGAAPLDAERSRLVSTIRSYLIPRAFDPTTPLTVVFAGPTGSGKSTLINSLVRRALADTGALRPTTTQPLVLASAQVADDYESVGGVRCLVVTGDAPVLADMVLVDTPDIDSVAMEHRTAAEVLVDHSDVVVFVTSALRYADDIPWQILRRAKARGNEVINVLNRVGSVTSGAIVDFKARLRGAGLDDDLVTVPEHHLPDDGSRVPSTAIRALAKRLAGIASARERHFAETFDRVLRAVVVRTADLALRIDDLADDTDSWEAELSLDLTDRAARVRLGDITRGLYDPPPEKTGRWDRWRWRVANRLDPDEIRVRERAIVDRFVAVVHSDLRRWVGDAHHLDMSAADLVPRLVPVIRSAAEGWVGAVSRFGKEIEVSEPWLTEVALIHAASDESQTRAAELLLEDQAAALIDRVRRELRVRLDVIYQHAVAHLVEMARHSMGSPDISGLRAALGVVSATLAPVDA